MPYMSEPTVWMMCRMMEDQREKDKKKQDDKKKQEPKSEEKPKP